MNTDTNGPAEQCNGSQDMAPEATTQNPKTTTISTIAVQSGKTRLVIALLQVCVHLFLEIVINFLAVV